MTPFKFDFAKALAKMKADAPNASADQVINAVVTEPQAKAAASSLLAKPSQSMTSKLTNLELIESHRLAKAEAIATAARAEAVTAAEHSEAHTAKPANGNGLATSSNVASNPRAANVSSEATTVSQSAKDSASETTSEPSSASSTNNSQAESIASFNWDESQLRAIDNIMASPYSVLIGAAGSGKTTVVKEIVARLKASGIIQPLEYARANGKVRYCYNVAFCSFTGKAVEQLRKSIPSELQCCCETIHSLLEYAPEIVEKVVTDKHGNSEVKNSKIFLPRRTDLNPLPQSIIIIDESGMVGIELWNNLFKALDKSNPNLKIILIGDIHQLPAVIGKSILGYALASPLWQTNMLTNIHRQAMDNPIIANSHLIKDGREPRASESLPLLNGKPQLRKFTTIDLGALTERERELIRSGNLPRSYYDSKNKPSTALANFVKLIAKLYREGYYDPAMDQIIVPQNVGLLGQDMINQKLAPIFNSEARRFAIRASYETKFLAVGDKVMFTKNDYELGILNGMTGYIKSIALNASYTDYRLLLAEENNRANGTSSATSHLDFQVTDQSADFAEQAFNDIDKLMAEKSDDAEQLTAELEASHVVTVEYQPIGSEGSETREISLSKVGQIRGLLLAYAITCHKAQGSEYRRVVVLAHSSNSMMLSREWLYTAVTRARENLILVYNNYQSRGLTSGLRRQVVKGNSLEEKAKNFSLAEATSESSKLNKAFIPLGIFTNEELAELTDKAEGSSNSDSDSQSLEDSAND